MQDLHLGGSTPEEAAARKQQAEKRLARDIAQAVQYEEQRLETRWPYVSPCKKVCAQPATYLRCNCYVISMLYALASVLKSQQYNIQIAYFQYYLEPLWCPRKSGSSTYKLPISNTVLSQCVKFPLGGCQPNSMTQLKLHLQEALSCHACNHASCAINNCSVCSCPHLCFLCLLPHVCSSI